MPAGGTAVGFAYFAVAKFLGYTAFCRWVIEPRVAQRAIVPSTLFPSEELVSAKLPSAFEAGAARTVVGLVAGAPASLVFFFGIPGINKDSSLLTVIFFALLVPIRIGEWWFLLWWMYREFPLAFAARGRIITFGILVSFALDAIGIFAAFVLPGGIWIC